MILPAVCLGWFQVGTQMRLIRSAMLDVLDSEFVKLTRITGLPEWKIVWKHCLRNAAIAPLTYFAITAGVLVTGSVVIESVFAWPGTGLLAVDAVRARDFQVVQAVVIVFATVFLLINLGGGYSLCVHGPAYPVSVTLAWTCMDRWGDFLAQILAFFLRRYFGIVGGEGVVHPR